MERKFRSIETGAIIIPNNKEVIEQLAKSEFYEEIGAEANNTNKGEKELTKKELVAMLKENGIEANDKMKKEDLLALLPAIDKE